MLEVAEGSIRAYFLFDVADTIDLSGMSALGGENRAPAALPLRAPASTSSLQFPVPPLVANLPQTEFEDQSCAVRLKFYDYGVVSLRLTFDAAGSWGDLVTLAERARTEPVARFAESTVMRICDEYAHAFDERHPALIEDYLTVEIERFSEPADAETLLDDHSTALAGLLLSERKPLAATEVEEALRVRFSYHEDDLTIIQWDTAFVYDRRENARAIGEILEFANSQLLELRTYDALLDRELDAIYKLQPGGGARTLRGRREAEEQAATLRYLIVDVLELIDRSSNALKVVGDAYYARIYRAAAKRLGLADWQRQIDTKLASVREMYRFFSDQARSRRDEFLEVIVIALIAIEVVIGILTLLHL
jgi:hypothetical protein